MLEAYHRLLNVKMFNRQVKLVMAVVEALIYSSGSSALVMSGAIHVSEKELGMMYQKLL